MRLALHPETGEGCANSPDDIETHHKDGNLWTKEGCSMSVYEMLHLGLMVLSIIITLILAIIDRK